MKTEFLGAIVLCCVIRYSQSAATSPTAAVTAAATNGSATAAPTVTTKATSASARASVGANTVSGTPQSAKPVTTKSKTTTTPKPVTCYKLTCKTKGCLKTQTSATVSGQATCTGAHCKITRATSGNVTTITAGCETTCTPDANTYCCDTDKCNNDESQIAKSGAQGSGVDGISAKYFGFVFAQLLLFWSIDS